MIYLPSTADSAPWFYVHGSLYCTKASSGIFARIMKLIFALVLLISTSLAADRPCVAFHSEASDPQTAKMSRDALEIAVTLSGEYDFYPVARYGCRVVDEISFATTGVKGYVISFVVLDPADKLLYHGVVTGSDEAFDNAMRRAATEAIKNIRAGNRGRE